MKPNIEGCFDCFHTMKVIYTVSISFNSVGCLLFLHERTIILTICLSSKDFTPWWEGDNQWHFVQWLLNVTFTRILFYDIHLITLQTSLHTLTLFGLMFCPDELSFASRLDIVSSVCCSLLTFGWSELPGSVVGFIWVTVIALLAGSKGGKNVYQKEYWDKRIHMLSTLNNMRINRYFNVICRPELQ